MTTPSWFLDELKYAGEEHLDTTYVPVYDQKAGTDPAVDVQRLLDLGLNDSHTLVDLGAGTGAFARAVATHARRVVAVDVSPAMLRYMREKASQSGLNHVEVVQGGFLSYQHEGDLADFVYSRHALHHLPDFWKALAIKRIADVLKPGGVLHIRDLIFSCKLHEMETVIEGWLGKAAPTPDKGWTRAELETHIRTEYSTFSWLLEPMLEQAGFEIRQAQHSPSQIYSEYTCVKAV